MYKIRRHKPKENSKTPSPWHPPPRRTHSGPSPTNKTTIIIDPKKNREKNHTPSDDAPSR